MLVSDVLDFSCTKLNVDYNSSQIGEIKGEGRKEKKYFYFKVTLVGRDAMIIMQSITQSTPLQNLKFVLLHICYSNVL